MATTSLERARQRLLHAMLVAFALLGLPAVLVGGVEAVRQGHPETTLLYLGLYLPVLAAAVFPRRIPFPWRSFILFGNLYLLGLSNLLLYGFSGAGIHILLTLCVLVTMLSGGRAGLLGIVASLVAIVIAGVALSVGIVEIEALRLTTSTSPIAWATAFVTFLMLSGASVATAGLVQAFLHRSLARVREQQVRLRASETKYRLLAESTHDLIITLDLSGQVTYANGRAWETILPERGENHAASLTEELPAKLREPVLAAMDELGSDDGPVVFETGFADQTGRRLEAEVTATPIFEDGRMSGVLVNVRDISQRKEAEEALRRLSSQFQALMDHSPALVNVVDREGRYRLVSAATADVLGLREEEVVGKRFSDLLPPSTAAAFQARLDQVAQTGRPVMVKDRLSIHGEERVFETTLFPLEDAGEEPLFGSIATDITEQERMEEKLRHQERLAAVGQLAAGIAHDFRNLLATILLYAEMGMRAPDVPGRVIDRLKVIVDESKRAADLVQQILDFSSRAMMDRHTVDLAVLTRKTIKVLRETIPESTAMSMEVEPGRGVGLGAEAAFTVEADASRLRQVLTNLTKNAHDAMPEGGELAFSVSRVEISGEDPLPAPGLSPGAWVRLEVSDTGTGMTEEVQAHLFEPFFTTKEVGEGTGLGLAQVYGIVRQHGGAIGVETAPGEGTTFRIYLPARDVGS
jgi:PAS domain S-box-containing protein